jgi:signal transduction histidine kinase
MAEMARAFGHEINNTLAAMVLRVEMLAQDVPAESPAQESIGVLDEATRQGVELVRRVRHLARLSRPLVPRPVDLAAVVMTALAPLRERLPASVKVATEPAPVPPVPGDAAELTLAVGELITNAFDAVAARGGCVRIATGMDERGIYCRIADDGAGISAEILPRVFDPFVTTRDERGRGLGLTIALAVAARHDGDVVLGTAPAGGCIATLRLPPPR